MEIFKTETTEQHLFQHNTADIGVVLWGWGGVCVVLLLKLCESCTRTTWWLLSIGTATTLVSSSTVTEHQQEQATPSFHTLHFGLFFAKFLPLWASYLLLNILLGEDFPSAVQ